MSTEPLSSTPPDAGQDAASPTAAPDPTLSTDAASPNAPPGEPAPSYVKLAMRNMVRKGGKSLFHFSLTVTALLGLLVGLAYLTR
ncbi:MAG: DUF3285 domain-containing protein [Cyanobacteria bacterium P01_A01_bin.135]